MLGWTDTETCCPKQVKADGSLASLASDTGALSSAMHTSDPAKSCYFLILLQIMLCFQMSLNLVPFGTLH